MCGRCRNLGRPHAEGLDVRHAAVGDYRRLRAEGLTCHQAGTLHSAALSTFVVILSGAEFRYDIWRQVSAIVVAVQGDLAQPYAEGRDVRGGSWDDLWG